MTRADRLHVEIRHADNGVVGMNAKPQQRGFRFLVLTLRVGRVGWHHADVSSYARRFTSPRLAGGRCAAT